VEKEEVKSTRKKQQVLSADLKQDHILRKNPIAFQILKYDSVYILRTMPRRYLAGK